MFSQQRSVSVSRVGIFSRDEAAGNLIDICFAGGGSKAKETEQNSKKSASGAAEYLPIVYRWTTLHNDANALPTETENCGLVPNPLNIRLGILRCTALLGCHKCADLAGKVQDFFGRFFLQVGFDKAA